MVKFKCLKVEQGGQYSSDLRVIWKRFPIGGECLGIGLASIGRAQWFRMVQESDLFATTWSLTSTGMVCSLRLCRIDLNSKIM